jgi:hypothetical protein
MPEERVYIMQNVDIMKHVSYYFERFEKDG